MKVFHLLLMLMIYKLEPRKLTLTCPLEFPIPYPLNVAVSSPSLVVIIPCPSTYVTFLPAGIVQNVPSNVISTSLNFPSSIIECSTLYSSAFKTRDPASYLFLYIQFSQHIIC